jgi:hypothetical protein
VIAEEVAKLCVIVGRVCPTQQMIPADEKTGEPGTVGDWLILLSDVRYGDACEAVYRLARKQRFIAPSEIIEMVAVVRAERLDAIPEAQRPVPNVDPNDWQRYLAGKRAIEKKIADGDIRSDGAGGWILPSTQWQHAIASGPTVEREIDYSQVFSEARRTARAEREAAAKQLAEREQRAAAREHEERERERQQAALLDMQAAYDKARRGKLRRKRKLSKERH